MRDKKDNFSKMNDIIEQYFLTDYLIFSIMFAIIYSKFQ